MKQASGLDRVGWAIKVAETISLRVVQVFALLFVIAIFAIVIEVVARYNGFATSFSVEYSGYVMASVISWACSYALLQKSHIRIDFLYTKRSDSTKNALDVLSIFLFFLVAAFFAWSSIVMTLESLEFDSVSNTTLRLPLWIPQGSWALGFLWLCVCSGLLTIRAVMAIRHRDRASMVRYVGTGEDAHF